MSFQASIDSDDSEVSLHSDTSETSKTNKKKKKRSVIKDYFSKQNEHSSSEHGRTSLQHKSYTESLLRKRFKKLINKNEIIQSPTVSYTNTANQSISDDENSVKTIFPERKLEEDIAINDDNTTPQEDEPEEIEPAIDALEEIHPMLGQITQTSAKLNTVQEQNHSKQQFNWAYNHIFLIILLIILIITITCGAPFYFITLVIGIIIPICTNIIANGIKNLIKKKLYIQVDNPQKTEFVLPKYNEMNILEVPSIEEYQVPKSYEGWINLYPHFSYDPETYHLSDTIPVYIKLKGKHLILYYTKNHIPRRTTYNEPELKLNITSSVVYNLKNAKVSLLPEKLARIRHWSKKYPICIEIENTNIKDAVSNEELVIDGSTNNQEKEEFLDDFSDSTTNNTFQDNIQEDEFKDVEDDEENTCTRNSISSLGEDEQIFIHKSQMNEDKQMLLFFARANREKYDWYLRILTVIKLFSTKNDDDESINKPVENQQTETIIENAQSDGKQTDTKENANNNVNNIESNPKDNKAGDFENFASENASEFSGSSLMANQQYLKYMGNFLQGDNKNNEDEEKKNFNISISKDILWFNVLAGRVLLGVLNDPGWIMKIQERIQRKLSAVRLPYYIDELECSELKLGETPPKIHRASKPIMNDRGLWVDLDVSYEGLVTLVLSTKLNLMKLKKYNSESVDSNDANQVTKDQKVSAIYNSDIDDSADSSTSDDQYQDSISDKPFTIGTMSPTPRKQNNKSFLRVVDQVAASKFFQQATENKFVKKALVAVSNSQLRLQLDFRGLIGELVLNIPNPPSDRLWFGFRKPPRIWLTVHPAFGERNVTFTYVTNWIEKKICQEIVKNLVLPNMEDLIIPILIPQT